MAGYSGTPLVKKLGIKSGSRIYPWHAPQDYIKIVGALPADALVVPRLTSDTDIVHIFCKKRSELTECLRLCRKELREESTIWISWPKKSSKVPTEINEGLIREVALPLGFVDIKVCAVDDVWSGLKLVVRRENRKKP